ncbi:MAG: Holliday junction resolvase RuvX [Planctomycetota bacterium]
MTEENPIKPNAEGSNSLDNQGRLAGIDFGTVRIGIATCDPSQTWVTPLETYTRRGEKLDQAYFLKLSQDEDLCGWVVGLPIHCDGKESEKSQEVRKFCKWLHALSGLPYVLYDERFTTREARQLLQNAPLSGKQKKKRLDGLAAHLILTHYLDNERAKREYEARSGARASQNDALDDQGE